MGLPAELSQAMVFMYRRNYSVFAIRQTTLMGDAKFAFGSVCGLFVSYWSVPPPCCHGSIAASGSHQSAGLIPAVESKRNRHNLP